MSGLCARGDDTIQDILKFKCMNCINSSIKTTKLKWIISNDPQPYNSWGNGSAMRVSPVGWYFDTLEETLAVAKVSGEVTHNHPEGIKGAQAVAACVYLARTG